VIGTFAQAIVAERIKGNRFTIRTSSPNVEVSWQVTGIRQDAWARKNRIRVETDKDERERGRYSTRTRTVSHRRRASARFLTRKISVKTEKGTHITPADDNGDSENQERGACLTNVEPRADF